MKLTEHFTLEEMTFSERAHRAGVDNTPGVHERENLVKVAQTLEQIRELIGPMVVTSGYRSPTVNVLVGGSLSSDHIKGLACDFRPTHVSLYDAARAIESSGVLYDQLILEYGWIHIGIGPRMRRQSLTKKSARAPYIPGLFP